jgi:hemin uptake protein HemP
LEREERALRKAGICTAPNPAGGGTVGRDRPPCYSTHELFGAARMVSIIHDGQVYRMQITRMGKLILTK